MICSDETLFWRDRPLAIRTDIPQNRYAWKDYCWSRKLHKLPLVFSFCQGIPVLICLYSEKHLKYMFFYGILKLNYHIIMSGAREIDVCSAMKSISGWLWTFFRAPSYTFRTEFYLFIWDFLGQNIF